MIWTPPPTIQAVGNFKLPTNPTGRPRRGGIPSSIVGIDGDGETRSRLVACARCFVGVVMRARLPTRLLTRLLPADIISIWIFPPPATMSSKPPGTMSSKSNGGLDRGLPPICAARTSPPLAASSSSARSFEDLYYADACFWTCSFAFQSVHAY